VIFYENVGKKATMKEGKGEWKEKEAVNT